MGTYEKLWQNVHMTAEVAVKIVPKEIPRAFLKSLMSYLTLKK